MAGLSITQSSQFSQQAYRRGLILEAETRALLMALSGTEDDNVFVIEESPGVTRGTNMKLRFKAKNRAPMPRGYGADLYGNEQSPAQWHEYSFDINYLVLASGAIENAVSDNNEVDIDLLESEQIKMAEDAATITEYSLMHQVAGYTPVNASAYTVDGTEYVLSGCNPCTAPDAAHHFFCPDSSGENTTEAQVAADSTAQLTNRVVDKALAKLQSKFHVKWPLVVPRTPWGRGYVLLCSLEAMRQVKENSSESDIYDLEKACIMGGMDPMNASIWNGEGFKINNTFYLASDYCTLGCSGETAGATTAGTAISNVARAVLLGARAAHGRYGEGFAGAENHLGYSEHNVFRRMSMLTDTVWGWATTIIDGQRWGSAVISHYTDATTTGAAYT